MTTPHQYLISIDRQADNLLTKLVVTSSIFHLGVLSSWRCASSGGRPNAQLLSTSSHVAVGVATVTARPDPRLPGAFQPR